ncbi:MAG TPA: BrnT family toxin [Thermodesulfobacteriota bacterium]|nr:BrnT family toxin [Thermodesulfobacteriota bacterium]
MSNIRFDWDENKNVANKRKHKVSFEEAKSVFYDEHARLIADPDHSQAEDRFILLGLSYELRVLVIVHTYRESEETIRFISARKATKKETKLYERRK